MTTIVKLKSEYQYNDDKSDKCGELFVTKTGEFSCFCITCKRLFNGISIFTEHFFDEHLSISNSNFESDIHSTIDIFDTHADVSISCDSLKLKEAKKSPDFRVVPEEDIKSASDRDDIINETVINAPKVEADYSQKLISNIVISDPLNLDDVRQINDVKSKLEEHATDKSTTVVNNSKKKKSSSSESDNFDFDDKLLEKLPFTCDICNRAYKLKHAYVLHKNQHKKEMGICPHCRKQFHPNQPHNIALCADKYLNKQKKSILKNNPGEKCKYCWKTFQKSVYLKKHEDRHLNSPFKCEFCLKSFMVKHLLDDHTRTHTGERPFKCEYCPAAFGNATNLKRHILIHTGEKTCYCNFGCGKAFFTDRERAGHERSHTGEKPFVCELCGRHFAFQHQLSLHKKRFHMDKKNRAHKCNQCDKAFIAPRQLREHIVVHTGEKPFACDQCSGRFSKYSGLREHRKLHTGIKQHICSICNKAFAQTAGLYGHMKSHGVIKANIEMSSSNI